MSMVHFYKACNLHLNDWPTNGINIHSVNVFFYSKACGWGKRGEHGNFPQPQTLQREAKLR